MIKYKEYLHLMLEIRSSNTHWFCPQSPHNRVGAKQHVNYLGGKGLGIQQGTRVWVGSFKTHNMLYTLRTYWKMLRSVTPIAN